MFCWQCGGSFNRRLDGSSIFQAVSVDGAPRLVHLSCATSVSLEERARTMTKPADVVPRALQLHPESRYG